MLSNLFFSYKGVLFLFFLFRLALGLLILLIFPKDQLLVLLTFSLDFLFAISLISALILIILLMLYGARFLTEKEGTLQIWNDLGKKKEPCGDVVELKVLACSHDF